MCLRSTTSILGSLKTKKGKPPYVNECQVKNYKRPVTN